jgi:hypothetical protein
MLRQSDGTSEAGALWYCDSCRVWWGSQVGEQPQTSFLLRLPEAVTSALGWENYRGWKYANDAPSCPNCGTRAARARFSVVSA